MSVAVALSPPMPIVSTFYGIVIRMYHVDHNPPHFHASYGGKEAIVDLRSGSVLAGALPTRVLKMVEEWRSLHEDDLRQAWDRAQNMEVVGRIEPLE